MPPLNKFTRTCLALAISQAVITPANAANIIVNDDGDGIVFDGNCNLREAIISANNDNGAAFNCVDGSGADSITFSNAVGPTISLTSLQISIFTDLTITGPGATSLTIDGSGRDDRIFFITGGVVNINGLTISGGSVTTGGGVYSSNSILTIENTVIENNTASVRGGGVFSKTNTVNIINSDISGNRSSATGGAIYQKDGSLNISNSTISDNSTDGSGGGIHIQNDVLDITGSTIANNYAKQHGGGIYAYTGNQLFISNSTISGNTSVGEGGGFLLASNTSLSLNNSTVVQNRTAYGASAKGGAIISKLTVGLNITNSIISGNGSFTGNEFYASATSATFTNSILGDDQSTYAQAFTGVSIGATNIIGTSTGAGFANLPLSTIVNSLADNSGPAQTHSLPLASPAIDAGTACVAAPVSNLDQRGVTRDGSCDIGAVERVTKSIVVDITLDTSGDGAICTLRDAITSSNTNNTTGGCAAGGDSTLITFDATTFSVSATNQITLSSILPIIIAETTITGQGESGLTIDANGNGPVISINGATASLNSLTITGGSASGYGGGIYARTSSVNLSNSTVSANSAPYGGGIYARTSSVNLSNSTVSANSAPYGGGIYARTSSVNLSNSTVSANLASSGGGIYARTSSIVNLSNSTLSGNSASSGGGIHATTGSVNLSNSVVAGNSGSTGAEIRNHNGSSMFATINNLLGDSSHTDMQAFAADFVPDASDINATSSSAQATNLSSILAPLADNGGATQTHALVANSPAIDAGDNAICAAAPINNLDQRGEVRPEGSACDIGAFEGFIEDSSFYVVPLPNGKSVIFGL